MPKFYKGYAREDNKKIKIRVSVTLIINEKVE